MTEKPRKTEPPLKLDMSFDEALERFTRVRPDELGGERPAQGELELIHYEAQGCASDFSLDPTNETVWATQQQIADTFGISPNTVGEHLGNIYREGELDQAATTRKFRGVGRNGREYNLLHYSLDAILSVGYRVSSKRATEFRKWATQTLKEYIVQGFALDEARLRSDPKALRELAAKVRELRSGEVQIYQAVRDAFKIGSADYNKDSPQTRSFYAKLQDKFLFAFWRSDKSGRAANGGRCDPVVPGTVHKEPGPLLMCQRGTLHATLTPPKWKGERWWVVALIGEVQGDDMKLGCLEREIIGECL